MGWIARALATGHGFSSPYYPLSGPPPSCPRSIPGCSRSYFASSAVYSLTSAFVILTINSVLSTLTCIPFISAQNTRSGFVAPKSPLGHGRFIPSPFISPRAAFGVFADQPRLHGRVSVLRSAFTSPPSRLRGSALAPSTESPRTPTPPSCPTLPFLLGFALWQARKGGKRWVLNGALTLITFFAFSPPWTIRNYRALGVIVPIRDNIWLELYADDFGNAPNDHTSPPTAGDRGYPADSPAELQKYLTMGEIPYLAQKKAMSLDDLRIIHTMASWSSKLCAASLTTDRLLEFFSPRAARSAVHAGDVLLCLRRNALHAAGYSQPVAHESHRGHALSVDYSHFSITYYLTHPMMTTGSRLSLQSLSSESPVPLSLRRAQARKHAVTADRDLASEAR